MPRTLFDKVIPEYRSAIVPQNHWMSVCHGYYIPNQPGPPPCCRCCPRPRPVMTPRRGHCLPVMNKAPLPCGFHESREPEPVISPLVRPIR